MKQKVIRALSLSLALLLLALTLSACGGGTLGKRTPGFHEIYKTTPLSETAGGYTSHKVITAMAGATEVKSEGVLVCYKSAEGIVSVYNTELDRVVLTLPESVTSTSVLTLQGDFIRVVTGENQDKKTTVYSDTGTLLTSAVGGWLVNAVDEGFTFAGKLYKVEDGALAKTFTIPPFVNLEGDYSESYYFAGDYLIHIRENDSVVYYNEDFEAVARYQIPRAGILSYDITVLESGKLFVWYEQYCDSASTEYDYYDVDYYTGRVKLNLFAEVFDPVKEKTTEVDLDGVRISRVWEDKEGELADYDCFTDAVPQILEYQRVVDGNIDYSRSYYVVLDDEGELGVSLDNFIEGQMGLILPLTGSYYYCKTETGYAILDTAGTLLQDVPAIGEAKEYGYLYKNKIYDHDFNLAVNLDASDITVWSKAYDTAVLYYRKVDTKRQFYIYDKNGEHLITAPEGYQINDYNPVELYEKFYYVRVEKTGGGAVSYAYYSFGGTPLFHAKSSGVTFVADDLISYEDRQGNLVYALMS